MNYSIGKEKSYMDGIFPDGKMLFLFFGILFSGNGNKSRKTEYDEKKIGATRDSSLAFFVRAFLCFSKAIQQNNRK